MSDSLNPTQNDVVKALMAMAAIYDKALSQDAADMLVGDLSQYEPAKILGALKLCRLELNRFPTTAEIIKRMSVKSEAGQTQEIVATVFKAIAWYGYINPQGARAMIGEVGWKAVEFMGGWQRLCDSPCDDASVLRAQLRKAVESSVEEKIRCDVLGIPFEGLKTEKLFIASKELPAMRGLDFSGFLPDDKEPA